MSDERLWAHYDAKFQDCFASFRKEEKKRKADRAKATGESNPQVAEGRMTRKQRPPTVQMQGVPGEGLFIVVDGKRIAERGPDRTWVPLEAGWTVIDDDDGRGLSISFDEVRH